MFSTRIWVHFGLVVAALAVFIPRIAAQTISCSSDDASGIIVQPIHKAEFNSSNNVANRPAGKATALLKNSLTTRRSHVYSCI